MNFTLSARHCGTAVPTLTNIIWMWPAMVSVSAGVAPL